MDFVSSQAQKVADWVIQQVIHQLGYLIFYNRNLEILEDKIKDLKNARTRMHHGIDEATTEKGQSIEDDVKKWCAEVDEMIQCGDRMLEDKRQSKGSCPHLSSRRRLSSVAKQMAVQVTDKIRQGDHFQKVGFNPPPLAMTPTQLPKDTEELESRTKTIEKIMETLKDDGTHTIGVWGTGGVGKTTVAKQVQRQALEQNLFDAVVMTKPLTVRPNLKEVQEVIAESLGMKLEENTDGGRAHKLRERIKKEKSILVVIDDVWACVDSWQLGIPLGNEHKGCKLLVTSRNLEVLDDMEIQKKIELKVLGKKESLTMFEKMVGDDAKDPKKSGIVTGILERCAGLPVLIATIAKYLKNKPIHIWEDALTRLKEFDGEEILQKQTYTIVELSYNNLKSEELKAFFLLIALQEAYYVDKYDLLIQCFGSGLFKNVETLKQARNRLHTLTNQLKTSCLLIEDEKTWVIMHDVIRDAAVFITSKNQKALNLEVHNQMKEWPETNPLEKQREALFSLNQKHYLVEKFVSEKMRIFTLAYAGYSMPIPDSFPEETREIKVLAIQGQTSPPYPYAPKNLGFLKSLVALNFFGCILKDISIVGELSNLKILRLAGSYIIQLPKEIGQLDRLQLLDVNGCWGLKCIPSEVLSKLTMLEEMYANSYTNWEVEGQTSNRTNASLQELFYVKNLTSIELGVKNAEAWPEELFYNHEKLDRFKISIGDCWHGSWNLDYESKGLQLKLKRSIQSMRGIKKLLEDVEELYLDELNGVKNVVNDLSSDGFPHVIHLTVQNNPEIKCIAINLVQPLYAFPSLESLRLSLLPNLEYISHGPLADKSLGKIRSIDVFYCQKLKTFFSDFGIECLSHLATLKVSCCTLMEAMVLIKGAGNLVIEFSELRYLYLVNLPSLLGFCFGETQEIDKGDNPSCSTAALFNDKVSFPNLEKMYIHYMHKWTTLILSHQNVGNSFCNLKIVLIHGCEKLVTIFPASIVRNLGNLESLNVGDCNSVEAIFELSDPNKEQSQPETRLQLKSLVLVRLPKLKNVWNNANPLAILDLQKLEEVAIHNCPMLDTAFTASLPKEKVQFSQPADYYYRSG